MKVLLTGGSGYIGSHIAVALNKFGIESIIFDNFSNSNKSVVDRINRISNKPIKNYYGDIRNFDDIDRVISENEFSAVIHLGGLKSIKSSLDNPINYYENNLVGMINLLKAVKKAEIKKIVFSSSATIYGAPKYLPIDETHPVECLNPYARTKLYSESILADIVEADKNFGAICLRYFNPAGAHESGLIGDDPEGNPENLFPSIARVCVGSSPFLNIYNNSDPKYDGTGVRDYIHVMDLAEAHIRSLEFLNSTKGLHRINIGTGMGFSVFNVVSEFQKLVSKPIPYKLQGKRNGDVSACYSSANYAKKMLGWEATRGLKEMCETALNFEFSKNNKFT
jgi:UDP-glucose 4-epimerase